MSDPTDTPLIYTSRGNLPMDQLDYSTRWEECPDFTKFIETYRYQGEVVRESAHVLTRQGLSFEAHATPLN